MAARGVMQGAAFLEKYAKGPSFNRQRAFLLVYELVLI